MQTLHMYLSCPFDISALTFDFGLLQNEHLGSGGGLGYSGMTFIAVQSERWFWF